MAKKKTAPVSEADAMAAAQTVQAFLNNKDKASPKAALVAQKVINRFMRADLASSRAKVAAMKKRLKGGA